MSATHLDAVLQIQAECYPAAMQEARELIGRRLQAAPGQCWVAVDDGDICAYLFAYLSRRGHLTPLNGSFEPHPQADCLYLHDLAVARRAAGRRIGPQLVAFAMAQTAALRLPWSALVSVQDSAGFWERLGYGRGALADPQQHAYLASYPTPARYMERARNPAPQRGQIASPDL